MDIAILGCGAMGHIIKEMAENDGINVAAMIEPMNGESLTDITDNIDAVIDFSNPANLQMMIDFAGKGSRGGKPACIHYRHNRIYG